MEKIETGRRAHTVMALLSLIENQLPFVEAEGMNDSKLLKELDRVRKILATESMRQFKIYEANR